MQKFFIAFILVAAPNFSEAGDFYGYYCTDDCSGHQAGWDWAERNGITATYECGGRSQSFIEGCWAYVEQTHGDDPDDLEGLEALEDCEWEYGEGAEECEQLK